MIDVTFARRVARRLVSAGLVEARDVRARHRGGRVHGPSERWMTLSSLRAGRAIVLGAEHAGVEDEAQARASWRRLQQPARAEHALMRNDYFLLLTDASRRVNETVGCDAVRVPVEECWGESCPDFPLVGAPRPAVDAAGKKLAADQRKFARPSYEWLVPDGRFLIEWPERGVPECLYDLEVETASRTGHGRRKKGAVPKIEARAGWQLRLFGEREREEKAALSRAMERMMGRVDARQTQYVARLAQRGTALDYFAGLGEEAAVPVIFVYPRAGQALRMRDRVREELEGGRMPRTAELARRAGGEALEMVAFCGYDELAATPGAALRRSYVALAEGEEREGWRMNPYEVAEAASMLRDAERPGWRRILAERGWDR